MVALDMRIAFDIVIHSILMNMILESSLPSYMKRLLVNYIRGIKFKYRKDRSIALVGITTC